MRRKRPMFLLALCVANLGAITEARPSRDYVNGKASWHPYRHEGYVTAARGVRRGAVLEVRASPTSRKYIHAKVVDSGPYKPGRVLDLNPKAFEALYGSLGKGVRPVSYRQIKPGYGQRTGKR